MADSASSPRFDLPGLLRRVRRRANLSQRELAARLRIAKSTVAAVETGATGMDARLLAIAAGLAGLRLGLLDEEGREVHGMVGDAVRDEGGRRFPAHLDTMLSEERWWRWAHRRDRTQPTYTFDRRRPWDDAVSRAADRPDDHLRPRPGDSPHERAAARRRAAHEKADAEFRRRLAAGEVPPLQPFDCQCPSTCDELDDRSGKPVHAPECSCGCDVA